MNLYFCFLAKNKRTVATLSILFFSLVFVYLQNINVEIVPYYYADISYDVTVPSITMAQNDIELEGYGLYVDRGEGLFTPYISQVGLHGFIYYGITQLFQMDNPIIFFEVLNAAALALVALGIVCCLYKKYNLLLASCFYVTFLTSPWITMFARNVYWLVFLLFLPMLLGLLYTFFPHKLLFFCIAGFFAILLKSLCGYEFLSTIMLGFILFPVVDLFAQQSTQQRIKKIKHIIFLGLSALLGFISAFLYHGVLRGEGNLITGIVGIYERDILRRTFGGDIADYPEHYAPAFESTPLEIIKMYLKFPTDILPGIKYSVFSTLILIAILLLVLCFYKKINLESFVLPLFCMGALATLSWLILGKSHNYFHVHINYILWYFGFVQTLFYILIKYGYEFLRYCIQTTNKP